MVRSGLGPGWRCDFANDIDRMKTGAYAANWGDATLKCGDVADVQPHELPGRADLAWASFPCQDLSVAGQLRGLGDHNAPDKTRSGTFWPFWHLVEALGRQHRAPKLIVLENVTGTLTSRSGRDFAAISEAFAAENYRFGALVCDARFFVPQSRPRLFFIAVAADVRPASEALSCQPNAFWHSTRLIGAFDALPSDARRRWLWWDPPIPSAPVRPLSALIEAHPATVKWNSEPETERLIGSMSRSNLDKVDAAKQMPGRQVGMVYKRTRLVDGVRKVRAEVRFDGVAGCLRTPSGGSSRQTVMLLEDGAIRSRLLSKREAARLMGLPDDYSLPKKYNDSYHVTGDGVCVPVVRYLAEHILEPSLPRDSLPFTLAA